MPPRIGTVTRTLEPLGLQLAAQAPLIARAGFSAFETPFDELESPEARQAIDELGLSLVSALTILSAAEDRFQQLVDVLRLHSCSRLVIVTLTAEEIGDHDAQTWRAAGQRLDRLGSRYKDAGIQLGYHNHLVELARIDGRLALDWLFEDTHPDNLFIEADLGWIYAGGEDPAGLIRRYTGRIRQIHLRDMDPVVRDLDRSDLHAAPADRGALIEPIRRRMAFDRRLGEGCFDWDSIVSAVREGEVDWLLNEVEGGTDPTATLRHSFEFMERLPL